jgi:hypothetical protein
MTKTLALGLLTGILALAGCEADGPVERAGEALDEAADEARDGAEEVAEEIEDAVDEVRDN